MALLGELRGRLGVEPAAQVIGLEVGCEMKDTMPRLIASSASARCVQCVMARQLAAGPSQARVMIEQIVSTHLMCKVKTPPVGPARVVRSQAPTALPRRTGIRPLPVRLGSLVSPGSRSSMRRH
jgi:hypothetical protein